MPKNLFDLRFAVNRGDGFASSVWRVWATKAGDVYLATRRMAAIEKYSFHKSMICRRAFTREHGTPPTMTDRASYKWVRTPTPPGGSGRVSRVAWIAIPTDFLSHPPDDRSTTKPITWIAAAPEGGATYIDLCYTVESEKAISEYLASNDRRLLLYQPLATGEAVIMDYYHSDWVNSDLRVPGEGSVADLLFSASDPGRTGRPVRITFGPIPRDGDAAVIQELGGYALGTP